MFMLFAALLGFGIGLLIHTLARTPWRFPWIELALAFFFLLATFKPQSPLHILVHWVMIVILVFIPIFDLQKKIIPTAFSLGAAGCVGIINLLFGFISLSSLLLGVLSILLVFVIQDRLTQHRHWFRPGLIPLGALTGAALGFIPGLAAVFFAYMWILLMVTYDAFVARKTSRPWPFASFLALEIALLMFIAQSMQMV